MAESMLARPAETSVEHDDVRQLLTVGDLVAAQAQRTPDAPAVVHDKRTLTYRELDRRANGLAWTLRERGVGHEDRVALLLPRGIDLWVAVLGVLRAGGTYVPLDPDQPATRLEMVLADTAPRLTLRAGDVPDVVREEPPPVAPHGDAAAYVIYTSGSTGRPKGVVITHAALVNLLEAMRVILPLAPGECFLAVTTVAFDMSVPELYLPLVCGATVVIADRSTSARPADLRTVIHQHRATAMQGTPSLWQMVLAEDPDTLRGLRIGVGGEPSSAPLVAAMCRHAAEVVNLYGPTETTVWSTFCPQDAGVTGTPAIGRPVRNTRVHVLDEQLRPVPDGEMGEIYIGGDGVARGYAGRPGLTAGRFVAEPAGPPGARMYRTGDLGRRRDDGALECAGRSDSQVKVRGFRVETGEVEAVLASCPGVDRAVVVARGAPGATRLVGYAVPRRGAEPTPSDLRDALAVRLPEYMVPSALVVLDALPLTPNGKVDRAVLREPARARALHRAPVTAVERVLADAFAEVLDVPDVGLDDDFLALGGDSVRAVLTVARARAGGVEIPLAALLTHRTPAALAPTATSPADGCAVDQAAAQVPAERHDPGWTQRFPGAEVLPCSPLQVAMVRHRHLEGGDSDPYQVQLALHLAGPVDAARLRAAVNGLLHRHAPLRAAFLPDREGVIVQVVPPAGQVAAPWREVDLSDATDEGSRERALSELLAGDLDEPFDPAVPPLLRATWVRMTDDEGRLVLSAHHALFDGWSEGVLLRDLLDLYASGGAALATPAPDPRAFAAWLAYRDGSNDPAAWARELDGVEGPTLLAPGADPGPAHEVLDVEVALRPGDAQDLARRATEAGTTLNTLVQVAWALVLGRVTGRRDVVLGATVAGRPAYLPGVEDMAGMLITTIPVRVRWNGDEALVAVAQRLHVDQVALVEHHHLGLSGILAQAGGRELFDSLVLFQSYPVDRPALDSAASGAGLTLGGVSTRAVTHYPVTVVVTVDPVLRVTVQHRPTAVSDIAASVLADGLGRALAALVSTPDAAVAAVPLLDDDELDLCRHVPVQQDPRPAAIGDETPTLQQTQLQQLLAEVLEVPVVGLHDDFFALGLNSLAATRLLGRVRDELGVALPVRAVFAHPTVAALSQEWEQLARSARPRLRKITEE